MPCQAVASARVPSRSTPIQPCWLAGRVEGTRSDGIGSAGAWLRSGADDFGAKRVRSHANMGSMIGKGESGARVEDTMTRGPEAGCDGAGTAPRAALVQKCKPAYGLCKGAKVRCWRLGTHQRQSRQYRWRVVTSGGRWRNAAEPWQERRSAPDESDVQKET